MAQLIGTLVLSRSCAWSLMPDYKSNNGKSFLEEIRIFSTVLYSQTGSGSCRCNSEIWVKSGQPRLILGSFYGIGPVWVGYLQKVNWYDREQYLGHMLFEFAQHKTIRPWNFVFLSSIYWKIWISLICGPYKIFLNYLLNEQIFVEN